MGKKRVLSFALIFIISMNLALSLALAMHAEPMADDVSGAELLEVPMAELEPAESLELTEEEFEAKEVTEVVESAAPPVLVAGNAGFEPKPPVRENGYYLKTGDLKEVPKKEWSGGNPATGVISGAWLSVAADFIGYESNMDGLLLKKYYENHLTEPLTEAGDYVWEMDLAIDTELNGEKNNTFSIDLYSSDKKTARVFSIQGSENLSLNGAKQEFAPENRKWYVLRAVLSLPGGNVSVYLLNRETGGILCQSENAATRLTDFSYIRWSSNKANSLAYLQDIKFYKNDADHGVDPVVPFHHIVGQESIYIAPEGTQDAEYQVYTKANQPMPNQEEVKWSLVENYAGVTLSGSVVTVSPEAAEGVIRLYAAYDGHEIYMDIILEKSGYGRDLAAGKELKYYAAANTDRFTRRSGETLATDRNSDTYYSTGKLMTDPDNKGGQIIPMLQLDNGKTYNVIRINYEIVKPEACQSLRMVRSANGGASSQYVDIVPSAELKVAESDRYIKMPVQSQPYLGFHFNTGTTSERFETEFKLYDFEVYYDGSQLNAITVDSPVERDKTQTIRVPVTAYDADGNEMTELSAYRWSGTSILGCANVEIDEQTGEVIIPPEAEMGTYKITLTNKENPELNVSTVLEIKVGSAELPDIFSEITGSASVIIPKSGEAEFSYKVLDKNGEQTDYANLISWSLAEEYPGASMERNTLVVTPQAQAGTVTLKATVGDDYSLTYPVTLTESSETVNGWISEIVGDKFVVSPYYGEQEFNTVQYTAQTYDGQNITDGVQWTVKGAPAGVTIDETTGVLSVPPNINDCKIKLIATKDNLSTERLITLVSRYDGGPNLLRLPGARMNQYANEGTELCTDGNFSTKSVTEKSSGTKSVDMRLPQNYNIDMLRVYKDFGGFENSYQTTARVNGVAFGGKGWSNSPLEADIWCPLPVFDTNVLTYTFRPQDHATDIYEMELYSSFLRFDHVESDADRVEMPSAGENTLAFRAIAENGQPVENITYADGETHAVKWELLTPAEGVSIDENTGVLTVTSAARPTTVTVRAIYFGRARDKAVSIGSSADASVLAQMDYDWLTFDKLTAEDPANITYKMKLYQEAPNGSIIEWKSSRTQFLTTAGDVYLPYTGEDADVVLTATIQNGSASLTKEFAVTIRRPAPFVDKNIVTDRELFGLWDAENSMWAVVGKLDYDASPEFKPIEEAIKALDYTLAKELLHEITVDRLKNTDNMPNISPAYSEVGTEMYMNSTSLYTTKAANYIDVSNERAWYATDVQNLIRDTDVFTMILHSEMKEDALVEVDSKESAFKPYILIKFKNGNEQKFEAQQDTTIRAGYHLNENYGTDATLRVMDSGYPIDSNTQRAYLGFDLSAIPNVDDIMSAQLFIHAENMEKTGRKRLCVLYYAGVTWEENTFTWGDTAGSMAVFSYSGMKNGFEFSYPPGSDAEVLLNPIGRLSYSWQIASGFPSTGDEKYAYSYFKLFDGFYDHAGENNSYPRGFDGYERNQRFMSGHKLLVNSQYMTQEMTTLFWKHLWELHNQVSISRDPFFNEVDNMMIAMTDQTITYLSEFKEFHDTEKWLSVYVDRMLPLLQRVILDDGSYAESSDAYAKGSIKTFASAVQKAAKIGVSLGDAFNERIYKDIYYYVAMHLPDYGLPGYGDSNPYSGSSGDSFVLEMANLYDDDELKYMSSNGKDGGKKPGYTSFCFPDSKRIFMRSDWTDDALYMSTNMDDSYSSHGHKDELSIVAYAYGDFLITDTGRYNYTWSDPINVELLSSQNHNTLGRITDMKTNKVYMQQTSGQKDSSTIKSWATSYDFDYFSGNVKKDQYDSGLPMGYNRKILFVKPHYWIVSDAVMDLNPDGKTDNKYDVMFHLMPGNNHVIDNEKKTVKTAFGGSANVQLLSPDTDVNITRETGIYAPQNGSYTTTDRIVFSKTKPAAETTTFDTVILPTEAGDITTKASVERIQMDVPSSVASAMHIIRENKSGTEHDYYYYSNERIFDGAGAFQKRNFGEFSFDGEAVFVSYDTKNQLNSIEVINGSTLQKNGQTIVEAQKEMPDLSISFDNKTMKVSSSVGNLQNLGNVTIRIDRKIDKVLFNNNAVTFSQDGDTIVLGSNTFITDPTVQEPDSEQPYVILPEITYGDSFTYGGNSYAVTVRIPEGTKIKPIGGWDGTFQIEIASAASGENIAGKVMIKTLNGNGLGFITPISISVDEHASATVSLVIDGRKVRQTQKLSSKDPSEVSLPAKSAGIYKQRDKLWIITNECTELLVGRIEIPQLPGGVDGGTTNPGGNGGGSSGGNQGGTVNPGGNDNPGGTGNEEKGDPFRDLSDVPWAEDAILSLYRKGIVNGKAEGIFAPNDQVTRAEYTAILVRAFGLKAEGATSGFEDVAEGQWYTEPIAVAHSLGIVNGISETVFGVNAPISRQDMMTMLYRIAQAMNVQFEKIRDSAEITDMDEVSDYAKQAIETMYSAGIVNGVGDGRIVPKATATRAETAKIVYEVLEKIQAASNED